MAKTTTTSQTMGVHFTITMVLFTFSLCMVCGCQTTRPDNTQRMAQLSAELEEANQKIEEMYHRLSVVQFMVDSHERILSDRDHKLKKSGFVKPEVPGRTKKTSEPSVVSEPAKGAVTEETISVSEQTKEADNAHAVVEPVTVEDKKEETVDATAVESKDNAVESGEEPKKDSESESVAEPEKTNETPAVEVNVEGKSPKDIYSQGFSALKNRDYPAAAAFFKALVTKYPNHDLADNSVYWTGEIFYDQKDYKEAIRIFNRLIETYPNGGKVPDALLKIGFSCHSLSDKESAVKYLKKVVVDFPFTDPGSKAEAMLNKIERP
jgi:tol-pal system protein YbgF